MSLIPALLLENSKQTSFNIVGNDGDTREVVSVPVYTSTLQVVDSETQEYNNIDMF